MRGEGTRLQRLANQPVCVHISRTVSAWFASVFPNVWQDTDQKDPQRLMTLELTTSGFDGAISTRVVFGTGCSAQVGVLARELGGRHILLVTDPGLVAVGHAAHIQRFLTDAGLQVTVFDRVAENPTSTLVEECAAFARAAGIDLIVGLGGGSSMDVAK